MTTTPNYGMNLPTDSDFMSDVDDSFNNSFDKIQEIPTCNSGASLPTTDFSYSVGDRFYHTGTNSSYILIAQNAAWGNFWRPIQELISPWVSVGTAVIETPTVYNLAALYYRITNTSRIIFGGFLTAVDTVNGFQDYSVIDNSPPLKDLPSSVANPFDRSVFIAAVYPIDITAPNVIMAQIVVESTGKIDVAIWNSMGATNPATSLFFDGVEWVMGVPI